MKNKSKKILGVLDLTKFNKLGEILMFIENIKIKKELVCAPHTDIAIILDTEKELFLKQLPILYNYLDIDNCILFNSKDSLINFLDGLNFIYESISPSEKDFKENVNPLDSTKIVKNFFLKENRIPELLSKPELKKYSKNFIKKCANEKFSIVVHLKNQSIEKQGNANLKEWYKFFKYCNENKKEIMFFLIGNNEISTEISSLPNIIITKKERLNITQELALIESAQLFMGMCSGPFQIALFNKSPYIVFKNPEHHKDKMIGEIGESDRFPFATDKQFIFREIETFGALSERFNKIYEKIIKET